MAVDLSIAELDLVIKKYVSERTSITGVYLHSQLKVKLSGYVDSATASGLVIRNQQDEFLSIDIAGASEFQMADDRDTPPEVRELASHYSSSLLLRLPHGAVVALFENKLANG